MKGSYSTVWAGGASHVREASGDAGLILVNFEGYVTKSIPHTVLKLISFGKLTFGRRHVVHRVARGSPMLLMLLFSMVYVILGVQFFKEGRAKSPIPATFGIILKFEI